MEAQVKKIDFTGQNIYAGFDVHKKSWKVTIMAEDTFYAAVLSKNLVQLGYSSLSIKVNKAMQF